MFLIIEKERFDELKQLSKQLQCASFFATINISNGEIFAYKNRYGNKGVISISELKDTFNSCLKHLKLAD